MHAATIGGVAMEELLMPKIKGVARFGRALRFVDSSKPLAGKHGVKRDNEFFPVGRVAMAPVDWSAGQPANVVDAGVGKA
jgi:hypothetical protein